MSDSRIAPEPCAIILPAIAALGAIASMAAVGWIGEDRQANAGPDHKRRTEVAVQELETCCLGLAEILRRLQRTPELLLRESGGKSAPLKFGVKPTRATSAVAQLYDRLINDVAAMLVLASQNTSTVMNAVEDGGIDAPEALFIAFGECQDELNNLLKPPTSLAVAVGKCIELADRLTALVRELKMHYIR